MGRASCISRCGGSKVIASIAVRAIAMLMKCEMSLSMPPPAALNTTPELKASRISNMTTSGGSIWLNRRCRQYLTTIFYNSSGRRSGRGIG